MSHGPQLDTKLIAQWRARAACPGVPHSLFFPASDTPRLLVEKALALCEACPVTEECLEYAFETNQIAGIWGGTTEDERKSLRRKWLVARRRTA